MMVFQVLFVLFTLFALSVVVARYREQLLSTNGFIFWLLFWVIAALVVLWPNSTQWLAAYLGIGRGTDLVIYVSVALIFFVLFRLHIKLERMNRDITKVVRHDALTTEGKE